MIELRANYIMAAGSALLVAALWWFGSVDSKTSPNDNASAPETAHTARLGDNSDSQPTRLAQESLIQELVENPLAECSYREFLKDAPVLMESSNYAAASNSSERIIGKKLHRIDGFKYPLILSTEKDLQAKDGQWHRTLSIVVGDHMIVKLKPHATAQDLEALCERHGSWVRRKMLTKDSYLVGFKAADIDTLDVKLKAFSKEEIIKWAESDPIGMTSALPDDSSFTELYGLNNTGQTGGTNDADIDAPEAWDISTGNSDILVAVIDSGVDYTHPDLVDNIWSNPGEIPGNGIDDDGNGFVDDIHGWDFHNGNNDPMDTLNHGTHCAGILGASGNNGQGVTGVCWDVKMVCLNWAGYRGRGSASDAADCVSYATLVGVRLTSNSWFIGSTYSQVLYDAIEEARDHDILFFTSAGNTTKDLDQTPEYPSSYDLDNIVNVMATDSNDVLADFSSFGIQTCHLAAPGVDVLSTITDDRYRLNTGTSMACPYVAGAAALVLSVAPNLNYRELKQVLLESVDPLPSLAGKCTTGGRLNVYNAMNALGLYTSLERPFDDDSMNGTLGNRDGFINPGETIGLNVTAGNSSIAGTFTNVSSTLSLTTASPYVTITRESHFFGTLTPQDQQTATYLIEISGDVPTPYNFSLEHEVSADGIETKTSIWNFTIYTPSTISGMVTEAGAPLAGALVHYDGAAAGEVMTSADGSYTISAIAGSYTLVATATGRHPSQGQSVTLVAGQDVSGIDFDIVGSEIEINPASIVESVPTDGSAIKQLTLSNLGSSDLTWTLQTYTSSRSDQAGGPAYDWIEISSTGSRLPLGFLSNPQNIPIGFDFTFYGQSFRRVNVSPNGWISFTSSEIYVESPSLPFPNNQNPENIISLFFAYLYLDYGGDVYYQQVDSETFVVQYEQVRIHSISSALATGQIVLKRDGRIFLNYKDVSHTESFKAGIQNADRTDGTTAFNDAVFESETTVLFQTSEPWLGVSPTSGVIPPGGSSQLTVTMDGPLAQDGINQAEMAFINNTLLEPLALAPVILNVGDGEPLPAAYAAWATETFANPFSDIAMSSNGDGDPMTNMMEFAFGTDPTIADGGPLKTDGSANGRPIAKMDQGTMHFYFVRRKDHGTSGSLSYSVQFSSDLSGFNNSSATPEWVADSSAHGGYEVVRVPYPVGSNFARIQINFIP